MTLKKIYLRATKLLAVYSPNTVIVEQKSFIIALYLGELMKVIYLEDEQSQADLICHWLLEDGIEAKHCANLAKFIGECNAYLPDFAILDWELPDGSGIDALRHIRETLHSRIPVLFTTQRDTEEDIVNAFRYGADDYLIKPLRKREFSARVEALSRRAGISKSEPLLDSPPYRFDIKAEAIFINNEPAKLTQKDFAVALCLFQHRGKPYLEIFF